MLASEASVFKVKVPTDWGYVRVGLFVRCFFSSLKASCWGAFHLNFAAFTNSRFKGSATWVNPSTKRQYSSCTTPGMPGVPWVCRVPYSQWCHALRLGSFWIPSPLARCLRKSTSVWSRLHFFGFSFTPYCLSLSRTSASHVRCSSKFAETIMRPSMYTRSVFNCNPTHGYLHHVLESPWSITKAKGYLYVLKKVHTWW